MSMKMVALREWAEQLQMPEECIQTALKYQPMERTFRYFQELFWTDLESFFREINRHQGTDYFYLAIYLRISYEYQHVDGVQTDLVKKGYYMQACQDLTIWAEDAYRRHGIYAITDGHYDFVGHLLNTSIVRLGRLEFQKWTLSKDVEKGEKLYLKNMPVINVHIPAGVPLSYEECEKSYALAMDFFRDFWSSNEAVFVCESWLLSPSLGELLPQDANINRFRKDYTVFQLFDDRQMEERVFGGEILEEPDQYVSKTCLQEKLKGMLLSGKKAFSAEGIYVVQK